jgi:hypothetical protein
MLPAFVLPSARQSLYALSPAVDVA